MFSAPSLPTEVLIVTVLKVLDYESEKHKDIHLNAGRRQTASDFR